MPLQATSGAASYDAFGGGVPVVPNYIEEVFSTYLYTGNDSTQTITNGIDLSTKGGLVWIKNRTGAQSHNLYDTARGRAYRLASQSTAAQTGPSGSTNDLTSFNTNGFSLGTEQYSNTNDSAFTYASWTFRKQPKFFDVVTYTGNGNSTSRNISHSLGSVAGTIIVKRTDSTSNWAVAAYDGTNWKVGTTTTPFALNLTNASTFDVGSVATSTTFNVCRMQWSSGGNPTDDFNINGATYVAYLFAHNAGGFGLTGTDNVISCGSFTCDGSGNADVTLGYEPQWLLVKPYDASGYPWYMGDIMRGMPLTGDTRFLRANTSGAETGDGGVATFRPTATGFQVRSFSQANIYIAIRRGPMKVPTSGTSVFAPVLNTGTGANTNISSGGFAPDMLWNKTTDHAYGTEVWDKLRGVTKILGTSSTSAEGTSPAGYDLVSFNNTGVTEGANSGSVMNISSWLYVNYMFGRAPSFFDEVCYTASISAEQTFNHNLGVTPELIFLKRRDSARNWVCWQYQGTNGLTGTGQFLNLNLTAEANASTTYNDGYVYGVSATQFAVNGFSSFNNVNSSCVAYLFSSCAGVSKVGSFTGNGSSQTINCGFTGGARFVLIKKSSGTGDWMVADSARGIVSGNDPYLELNNTNAEVTGEDWLDTDSTGFVVNEVSGSNANTNGATYIFLAIA